MKRGDIVTVIAPGDYGKPRPAVVIQADALSEANVGSVVICLVTSHLVDAPALRVPLEVSLATGLTQPSQIMTDKIVTVARSRLGGVIGLGQ